MRTLNSHIVNPANDKITIQVMDEPGQGGACHEYLVSLPATTVAGGVVEGCSTQISFQNGPIAESGVNGLTQEVLLAIVIDRLEGFQSGKFACQDNALALEYTRSAQKALQKRTRERMARNVEGTNKK